MMEKFLNDIEIRLSENYLGKEFEYKAVAKKIMYTRSIDAYFNLDILQYLFVLRTTLLISRTSRLILLSII